MLNVIMKPSSGTEVMVDLCFPKEGYVIADSLDNIDLSQIKMVWFTGGADISPSLYNAERAFESGAPHPISLRDQAEKKVAEYCIANGIPMVGICRGSQFLCAMAGGKLVQHVNKHANGNHKVETVSRRSFIVNSYHHQMMYPFGIKHKILAWAIPKRSDVYVLTNTDKRKEVPVEPEVVYFPTIKALGIQPHPEWMPVESPFVTWCSSLIKNLNNRGVL